MVTRNQLSLLIAFSLCNAPAFGTKTSNAGAPSPEPVEIKRAESTLTLRMKHLPLGRFDTVAVNALSPLAFVINGDHAKLESEPLRLDVKELKSLITLRDNHMKKVLSADKFPHISLKNLNADLKEQTFDANLEVTDKVVPIKGKIKRTAPGEATVTFKSKMFLFSIPKQSFLGVGVDDEFEVIVQLTEQKSIPVILDDPLDLLEKPKL